jgi:ankyrin repeat domain-containing protein 50
MDALDECSDPEDVRRDMLDHLEKLITKAPNIKVFATSRELHQIGEFMREQGAKVCSVGKRKVDGDIRRYVLGELSRDPEAQSAERSNESHDLEQLYSEVRWDV